MQITIETKFNKGDVVYYADVCDYKIKKVKIQKIEGVDTMGSDIRISYEVGKNSWAIERELFITKKEAQEYMKTDILKDIDYKKQNLIELNKELKKYETNI